MFILHSYGNWPGLPTQYLTWVNTGFHLGELKFFHINAIWASLPECNFALQNIVMSKIFDRFQS